MNTRQSIQPSTTPAVLSLSFSASRNRFITGLSDGLRVFRADSCLATYQPSLLRAGGVGIAEALDDRYIAFVGGGRSPAFSPNVITFWDCLLDKEINRFDLNEPVLGVRLSGKFMVAILQERTVVFEYQELAPQQQATPPPEAENPNDMLAVGEDLPLRGPNRIRACHATSLNQYALAFLRSETLVLPAQAVGQVQLIPLSGGSKRVMKVHNSAVRCMTLSPDGTILATASEAGTLIRVFDTKTQDQLAEFRRGVDHAIIYGLAISDANRWLACTSDKGTVHVFDLRPQSTTTTSPTDAPTSSRPGTQHRKSQSQTHRLSTGQAAERDTISTFSGRSSSPATATATANYPGSIQEYYGLRPPPISSFPYTHGPGPGSAALSAFKSSSLAPRIMKDSRSVASAPFYTGEDPPHWQGGAAHSWTTTPDGTRKRVKNAVPPLPGEPSGRPRKGVVAFAPGGDSEPVKLWVLGGGSDARWEVFEFVGALGGGGYALVRGGFRKFLTRQFVD